MPRFFFDLKDAEFTFDNVGTEFGNVHQARDQAIKTLPHVAKDMIGEGSGREVLVLVRNEEGRAVFTAALTLTAKWLVDTV